MTPREVDEFVAREPLTPEQAEERRRASRTRKKAELAAQMAALLDQHERAAEDRIRRKYAPLVHAARRINERTLAVRAWTVEVQQLAAEARRTGQSQSARLAEMEARNPRAVDMSDHYSALTAALATLGK